MKKWILILLIPLIVLVSVGFTRINAISIFPKDNIIEEKAVNSVQDSTDKEVNELTQISPNTNAQSSLVSTQSSSQVESVPTRTENSEYLTDTLVEEEVSNYCPYCNNTDCPYYETGICQYSNSNQCPYYKSGKCPGYGQVNEYDHCGRQGNGCRGRCWN